MSNNRQTLIRWFQQGYISEQDLQQALVLTDSEPNKRDWVNLVQVGALYLGLLALAAGIIFFFAGPKRDRHF